MTAPVRRSPSGRIRLAAVALLVSALAARPGLAADADALFTVAGVHVDETAANAVAARDAARRDGESRALRTLLERLTLDADHGRLPHPSDQHITDMVRDFEVANERSSAVRYIADETVRFQPDAIRNVLRQAAIPFSEEVSKSVVVLPVLRGGDQSVLWEDPNPWRDAWAAAAPPGGLVPLVVPLGDAEDIAAVDAGRALAGEPAALAAIAARYRAGDALVAVASAGPGGEIDVAARRVSSSGAADLPPIIARPDPGESAGVVMAKAVTATMQAVEEAWKRDTIVAPGQQGTLTATVPLTNLTDWLAVRDRLRGVAVIQSSALVKLSRGAAEVELRYSGDPARLRLALAQRDLVLSGSDGAWVLQRQRGDGAPP